MITLFGVWLQYNTSVLSPLNPASNTISYAGNILGSNAQPSSECVGASVVVGGSGSAPCGITPSPDILNLVLYNLGKQTSTSSGGLLYQVNFKVVGTGFSRLHIFQYVLTNGVKDEYYNATTVDGYFTNKLCGSSLCRPPHVDFTYSPALPSTFQTVRFNATASFDVNPGGRIVSYAWSWGESAPCLGVAFTEVTTKANFTHVFCAPLNYSVSLLISDSFGVTWSLTKVVQITYVFVDVTHGGPLVLNHQFGVSPGTRISITANIINNSTQSVPANVTITVENTSPLVTWTAFFNLNARSSSQGNTVNMTRYWNTTADLPIQAYRIDAKIVSSVPQNVTSDKTWAGYVQFVPPQAGGLLSLSLLQSSGLSILIIAAVVFAIGRFRKKPSWETEPLTQE